MKARKLVMTIVFDDDKEHGYSDPAYWDWAELLDLGPNESVEVEPLTLEAVASGCTECGTTVGDHAPYCAYGS